MVGITGAGMEALVGAGIAGDGTVGITGAGTVGITGAGTVGAFMTPSGVLLFTADFMAAGLLTVRTDMVILMAIMVITGLIDPVIMVMVTTIVQESPTVQADAAVMRLVEEPAVLQIWQIQNTTPQGVAV